MLPSFGSPMNASSLPSNLTVLIADDDEDMRLYLRRCLHSAGVTQILHAANGLEALHLARNVSVDLIITDIGMPGLDGHALHRALQADERLSAIPLLLISGIDQLRAAQSDAVGFLAKPFNAATLRTRIDLLLQQPPEIA